MVNCCIIQSLLANARNADKRLMTQNLITANIHTSSLNHPHKTFHIKWTQNELISVLYKVSIWPRLKKRQRWLSNLQGRVVRALTGLSVIFKKNFLIRLFRVCQFTDTCNSTRTKGGVYLSRFRKNVVIVILPSRYWYKMLNVRQSVPKVIFFPSGFALLWARKDRSEMV